MSIIGNNKTVLDVDIVQVVVAAILTCCVVFRSCYALATVEQFYLLQYPLLFLSLFVLLFMPRKGPSRTQYCVFLFILIGVLAIIMNLNTSNAINTLTLLLVFFCSYLIAERVPREKFFRACLFLLRLTCIASLLLWTFTTATGSVAPLPVFVNTNGVEYACGLFVFQYVGVHDNGIVGLFWEPGVFASFLVFVLALGAIGLVRLTKKDTVLFSACVLLTASTAGILLLVLPLFIYLLGRGGRVNIVISIAIIIFVAVAFEYYQQIALFLYNLNPSLFGKLVNTDMLTTSTRLDSPLLNLYLFERSPLFGLGVGDANASYIALMGSWDIDAQTSTTTYMMAAFGLGGILLAAMWICGVLGQSVGTFLQKIALLALVFLIFNKEPHHMTMFFYILLFYFDLDAEKHRRGLYVINRRFGFGAKRV